MNILTKHWFKIGILFVFFVLAYIFWFYFITVPKEKAAAKYMADLVLQKCLANADNQESNITTPIVELRNSEEKSIDQMRADCQSDYQLHLDQSYSRI